MKFVVGLIVGLIIGLVHGWVAGVIMADPNYAWGGEK